jgi:hypothetical protein
MDAEHLKSLVDQAFTEVEYPGDWCLRGSNEGDEPFLVEREFKGKTNWRSVEAEFLDQAPNGYSTALCFLSDEAFRFYLPAYLLADINGKLESVDPAWYLCHGLALLKPLAEMEGDCR